VIFLLAYLLRLRSYGSLSDTYSIAKNFKRMLEAIANQQKASLAILDAEQRKIAQLHSLAGEVALSGMRSRQNAP
jgi:hypothetical protein